jgi:hypothetical protein
MVFIGDFFLGASVEHLAVLLHVIKTMKLLKTAIYASTIGGLSAQSAHLG